MARLFQWFSTRLRQAQQRAMERDIEQLILRHGGRLTDQLEREIAVRVMAGGRG